MQKWRLVREKEAELKSMEGKAWIERQGPQAKKIRRQMEGMREKILYDSKMYSMLKSADRHEMYHMNLEKTLT